MSVSVVTPSLNKSFKFQSDWPYNNSQVYLLNSVLEDLKEDEKRTFEATDDGFVFTSKVHYPNNKSLKKQNVYMNKESKVTKVEVLDDDNNVLISMNYQKQEFDKKFDDDYFSLNSIIKNSNKEKENTSKEKMENGNTNEEYNNSGEDNVIKNKGTTSESAGDSNNFNENKVDNGIQNNNENSNNITNSNNNANSNDNNSENKTEETLSIEDVIYPMYLPENTYLIGQERVDTETGERLILTFGGDNSFILVEETIANNDSNLIIPVNGEFDFLSDVIGVIGTNSVMWHSNGVEYYMTSNTIETAELVNIARSISVLPVSK